MITMGMMSSRIIKKKLSEKSREWKTKRTSPASLVRTTKVSNVLADIIGMNKGRRQQVIKCLLFYINKMKLI